MNIEEIRLYCLSKPAASEDMPFGNDTLVFKVGGKMFLLANLDGPLKINIKAPPQEVADRLEHCPEAEPGYHMNKKHWIRVDVTSVADQYRLKAWIDTSYMLVLNGLPAKLRNKLGQS